MAISPHTVCQSASRGLTLAAQSKKSSPKVVLANLFEIWKEQLLFMDLVPARHPARNFHCRDLPVGRAPGPRRQADDFARVPPECYLWPRDEIRHTRLPRDGPGDNPYSVTNKRISSVARAVDSSQLEANFEL